MENASIGTPRVWTEGGLTFTELCRQEYAGNNCVISAGSVTGGTPEERPPEDTCYLRLEKDGEDPTQLLLRPDELQIIGWVAVGTVWTHLMSLKHYAEE